MRRTLKICRNAWMRFGNCPDNPLPVLPQSDDGSKNRIAEREQQLAQRELLLTAKEKLAESGLPVELLDALNVSSPEAMEKAITTVKAVIDKIKAAPPKFVGFQPGASGAKPDASGADAELRKAMRLS